jgi:hypothetical protein
MAERAPNDGQHRSDGPAINSGQRQRRDPNANVGQRGGGEQQMDVPGAPRDAMINTTSKSAGPLSPGERSGGADDR